MNTTIIADSSGIISLISKSDNNHHRAAAISEELERTKGSVIIPSDVFSETINIVGKKLGHNIATEVVNKIQSVKTFLIVDSDEKIRSRAMEKFKNQPSSVSFTDCMVMSVADSFNTKQIFGFDEVFRKNGYKRLGLD